jgi:hypothetical protein
MTLRTLLPAIAALCIGACTKSSDSADGTCTWREPDLRLNPGYVLLHGTMDAFSNMDKVLLIKRESDAFEEMVESVADYSGKLADQLEDLDEEDDEIDLQGQAMPEVIIDARKAMGKDMRETVGGPFKGATGSELERSLLLALDQGLGESHEVVRAIAKRETSKKRHAVLEEADRNLGELRRAVERQLVARHFCDKAGIDDD